MISLKESIDEKMGEVRTEALDLSFGEIVNLYAANELIIQPEYQRLFRWSDVTKSRLIESILLELPIPQIFVIENANGVLELIDGLQRVSSVIQFIDASFLKWEKPLSPLQLQGCDLIKDLNDKFYNDLSLTLKLRIKRSSIRTIIIKRQSKYFLRYEMFKRLHTGGESLEPQEIRNCSARMVGDKGINFYEFLNQKAINSDFIKCIESLPEESKYKKGDEELVLRFFASKNAQDCFRGSVTDWLDLYMESILLEEVNFNYNIESQNFDILFYFLAKTLGKNAFVSYKKYQPQRNLNPAYFEAITVGTFNVLDQIKNFPSEQVRKKIIETTQGDNFKQYTGLGANKKSSLKNRINTISNALLELVNE
ncbi:MAG: DUF262 domain-containing protein [Symploca sp. SIO2E6]|nr:DUF262 domain-containing protein [Symploca sp. SIO2E6]